MDKGWEHVPESVVKRMNCSRVRDMILLSMRDRSKRQRSGPGSIIDDNTGTPYVGLSACCSLMKK